MSKYRNEMVGSMDTATEKVLINMTRNSDFFQDFLL